MTRKYFQAKKTTSNPFALGMQYNRSQKHRYMVIALSLFIGFVLISSVISTIYRYVKGDEIEQPIEKPVTENTKNRSKRKEIKPIADEDFKDAKEYSFYTQLEERSLDLGGSDRFGGVAIENIHIAPVIRLESMENNKTVTTTELSSNNSDIAPLVLESASPSEKIDAVIKEKNIKPHADIVLNNRTVHLQIGSFILQGEAVNHRTKLEMYGFSPQIIRGENREGQPIYRVHLGPFSSKELPSIKERLNALDVKYFEVK